MSLTDDPSQTPVGPPARRRWLVWVFLAMVASPAVLWLLPDRPPAPPPLPPGWVRLTTIDDGLSVDLPANPKKTGPVDTPDGYTNTSWVCIVDGYHYGVRRMGYGGRLTDQVPASDNLLNSFCDGVARGLGVDGSAWQTATVGGRPGRRLQYRGEAATSEMRVVQFGLTLYFFLVGGPTPDADMDRPEVTTFFDSVRFAR